MSEAETFRYHSKRVDRAHNMQTLQHVVAALILIFTAWPHLGHGVLPYLELAAGAALIGAAIFEKVRKTHAKVGIVEVAGAAMLIVEGVARQQSRPHFTIVSPFFLQAAVLFALALLDEQMRGLRYLRATDDHLVMRSRLFRWRTVPWKEIRGYRVKPDALELVLAKSVKTLPLRDIKERDQALTWMTEQLARRGITSA